MPSKEKQAKWCCDHIDQYPMNWFFYFERVLGKDEYFVTRKQCAFCKLTKQESCEEVTKYLCEMDLLCLRIARAVLDRTKALDYGGDECNFHVMSPKYAKEIGFVQSPDARQRQKRYFLLPLRLVLFNCIQKNTCGKPPAGVQQRR